MFNAMFPHRHLACDKISMYYGLISNAIFISSKLKYVLYTHNAHDDKCILKGPYDKFGKNYSVPADPGCSGFLYTLIWLILAC